MKSLTKPLQHFSLARVAGTRGIIRDTEKVRPGSHEVVSVVKVVQKDLEDKRIKPWVFIFWVFLQDPNDPYDLVWITPN